VTPKKTFEWLALSFLDTRISRIDLWMIWIDIKRPGLITGDSRLISGGSGLIPGNSGLISGNSGLIPGNSGLIPGNSGLVCSGGWRLI